MILEVIREKDIDEITKLTQDSDTMRYVGNGLTWTDEKIKNFLNFNDQEYNRKNNQFYYIIRDKGFFVGLIGTFYLTILGDVYFNIIISPNYRKMGYFSKSLNLLKEKIDNQKIYMLINADDDRMLEISKRHFYMNKTIRIRRQIFREYSIFIRDYTFSLQCSVKEKEIIGKELIKRGNWVEYEENQKGNLDFVYLRGNYHLEKKNLLTNRVDTTKSILTNKEKLLHNLELLTGDKTYIYNKELTGTYIRLYYLVHRNRKYLYEEGNILTDNDIDRMKKYPKDLQLTDKVKNNINYQLLDLFEKVGKIEDYSCTGTGKDCYSILTPIVLLTEKNDIKLVEISKNLPSVESKFGKKLFESEASLILDSVFPPRNNTSGKQKFDLVYY